MGGNDQIKKIFLLLDCYVMFLSFVVKGHNYHNYKVL